tara:strand:+ start:428 stop:1090 length:663 start_codon:yes stop_codon:yes gene_type:complete
MANPKYFYSTGPYKGISTSSDAAAKYASASGHVLHFRDARNDENFVDFIAFLSSFSQSFTSNWNTEEVYGRMDPISTFKNTTRVISVAWDIPGNNPFIAESNLDRCNQLINLCYPSYSFQKESGDNSLAMSKPPLVRLKFANLITAHSGDGLLGYITSINWNPIIEMGYYNNGTNLYPKVIQISVEFQVLHEQLLGYDPDDKPYHGGDMKEHNIGWPFKK